MRPYAYAWELGEARGLSFVEPPFLPEGARLHPLQLSEPQDMTEVVAYKMTAAGRKPAVVLAEDEKSIEFFVSAGYEKHPLKLA